MLNVKDWTDGSDFSVASALTEVKHRQRIPGAARLRVSYLLSLSFPALFRRCSRVYSRSSDGWNAAQFAVAKDRRRIRFTGEGDRFLDRLIDDAVVGDR
jgi:hypothetical protein